MSFLPGSLRVVTALAQAWLRPEGRQRYHHLNANGGTVDFRGSSQDRTVATLNLAADATLHADGAVMAFTTRNLPSGLYSLAVS